MLPTQDWTASQLLWLQLQQLLSQVRSSAVAKQTVMSQQVTSLTVFNNKLGKILDEVRQDMTERFQVSTINLAVKAHGPQYPPKRA